MRKLAKETKKAIKEMGGKETINSGATQKNGDGIIDLKNPKSYFRGFLVESKFTEKLGFRITRDVLDKIKKEGYDNNRMGILLVGFINEDKGTDEFVAITKDDFIWLLQEINK